MNVEVNKLEGVLLDYFAGLANGYHVHIEKHQREPYYICVRNIDGFLYGYSPSEDVSHVGVIIEKYEFETTPLFPGWWAGNPGSIGTGDTLAKAVCRGLVRKSYGKYVEIPVEYIGIYEEQTMKKRNMFNELVDGFKDLAEDREGKTTLRTVKVVTREEDSK